MTPKNKFFNPQKQEPNRWVTIEKPGVYVTCLVLAIALSIAYCLEDSSLEASLAQTNERLLEIGYKGIFTSMLDAIPVNKRPLKVLIVALLITASAVLLYKACIVADGCIERMDADAIVPTPTETRRYTERLAPEAYEMQKMEYTRKQLEKLTASEEFKRHEQQKKQAKRGNVARSMLQINRRDIKSSSSSSSD